MAPMLRALVAVGHGVRNRELRTQEGLAKRYTALSVRVPWSRPSLAGVALAAEPNLYADGDVLGPGGYRQTSGDETPVRDSPRGE